ncbi:MAG: hypothetical protein HoeaKO_28130 [Hoeflea alexandrii]
MRQGITIDQLGGRTGTALHTLELFRGIEAGGRLDDALDPFAIGWGEVVAVVGQIRETVGMGR